MRTSRPRSAEAGSGGPSPMPPAKPQWRRLMRARRAAVPDVVRRRAAEQAATHLLGAGELRAVHTVLLHHPVGTEMPLGSLEARLRERGLRIGLPRVEASASEPRLLVWEAGAALEPDALGVPSPISDAEPLDWDRVDLVLVPALAIGPGGGRLGQGGGHYDRMLARMPRAWRVGWVLALQRVASLPLEAHDEAVHAVVSEGGLERLRPWRQEA